MSTAGKAQSKNAPKNKGKHVSATPPRTNSQSKKFRAAGQPAGSTSSNMLGENRYTPNPTNADPFAPLPPFPDTKTKMDNDCERSSVSDNDDSAQVEKPKPAPGKKTRGRVRIQMEYIQNKLRRYTTFSKRKSGIMKKAYELSTLTGTQVMLLVASETGHVYTFATPKLQPMITSEAGKALIQTCLHQPDPQPVQGPHHGDFDVRMSSTGYEETDLGYNGLPTEEDTFKNSLDMHIASTATQMPVMNPAGPIVTIPHGIMQMPFPVSLHDAGAPIMTSQPMMQPIQTLTSTPQTMSPHHSPPPSYSPPHQQPSSPPRTYTPVSYPGSPSAPPYSQASHVPHQVMGMDELGSPGHLHHGMDPYERSPSRSPIHSRYSPHAGGVQHSPRTIYTAPHGSPSMSRI